MDQESLRLDLGCGTSKREGFIGVDRIAFEGVDVVCDLAHPWPWENDSIDEVYASHVLEHFEAMERVHFLNELWRVLKPSGKATIIVPHWKSGRAFGDPTHKWPPVSEFSTLYWGKAWRKEQAPAVDADHLEGGFSCDFEPVASSTIGYAMDQEISLRHPEFQQYAAKYYTEFAADMHITLTKRAT